MSTKFDVPKFEGNAKDCEVVRAGERNKVTFVKLSNGAVHSIGVNGDRSILNSWAFNDAHRRAWCKLTGVPFIEVKAAMKALAAAEAKRQNVATLGALKRTAAHLGFQLRKLPAPKA
jgi:hypothetical protein